MRDPNNKKHQVGFDFTPRAPEPKTVTRAERLHAEHRAHVAAMASPGIQVVAPSSAIVGTFASIPEAEAHAEALSNAHGRATYFVTVDNVIVSATLPGPELAPPPPPSIRPAATHRGVENFAEKRAARLERMKVRADRMARVAESSHARARQIGSHIPFGQPILVGHHSERRHRNDLKKIDQAMRKSIEANDYAQTLERRIDRIEHGKQAISSDDPEAVTLLREKLAVLEAKHLEILAFNKELKKRGHRTEAYRTTNSSANIRTVKQRIEHLLRTAAKPVQAAETHGDVTIVEEDNRVQIRFPGKPSDSVRAELKSHGFRWAPSNGAWQRMASSNAWYWARQIVGKLTARDPSRKFERCVRSVKKSSRRVNPWAVCHASLGRKRK